MACCCLYIHIRYTVAVRSASYKGAAAEDRLMGTVD